MRRTGERWRAAAVAALCVYAFAADAAPLRAPDDLAATVGIDQSLGAQVPLDTVWRDAKGELGTLGGLLRSRPAILVPTYFHCTTLCGAVRTGVAAAVAASGLKVGDDFQVLVLSFDPLDSSLQASAAQRGDTVLHPDAATPRWNYLTGTATDIKAVMHSIGFRYQYDPRDGQYAHAAGVIVLSPDGKVMQYLLGVQFAPRTLRLALVNAAQGRIGSLVDQLILLCCRYDESTGRYSVVIDRILMGLGFLTLLALGVLLATLARRRPPGTGMKGAS